MHVTVAVCTWNRAALLDRTLESLTRVAIPSGVTWEVIVANNNSTDHTDAVIDKYIDRLPLTKLFVRQQGKSYALNEIVERLQGDLVLWTDDDVEFDEDWIASYVSAAERWPEAMFFGGWIVPNFLDGEPEWLRPAWRVLSGVYAARELGDEPFPFDPKCLPFGANMAVRVDFQKRYSYDPELGRRGELLLSGEETDLMRRWLSEGHVGMWVPESRVDHIITGERLELEHIRRFFFSLAESKLPRGWKGSLPVRVLFGSYYTLRAMKYSFLRLFSSREKDPYRWIKYLVRISYCWGHVETQWSGLPVWLKPPAVRRLKHRRAQPRPTNVEADEAPTAGHGIPAPHLKSSSKRANVSK